jgi:tetratricopeptide (TPR) repeat protein
LRPTFIQNDVSREKQNEFVRPPGCSVNPPKIATSLARYEAAADQFHSYFGNPLATIDDALAARSALHHGALPARGHAAHLHRKRRTALVRDSVKAAEALGHVANDRERGHIAAARAWLAGDLEEAVERYGAILHDYPRDILALQIAHIGDFFLGRSTQLRDRVAQVLPHWSAGAPATATSWACTPSVSRKTGSYDRAEATGRRALDLNRRDPWAVHAVAHVMEMQGRLPEGIAWLTTREADWAPENGFAYHNWWHLALYHLDLGDTARVLDIYDTHIRPQPSAVVLEMIDASAHARGGCTCGASRSATAGASSRPRGSLSPRMATTPSTTRTR